MIRNFAFTLAGALLLGLVTQPLGEAQQPKEGQQKAKKKLLVITESQGFKHSGVVRKVTVAKDATAAQFPKMDGLDVKEKGGKVQVSFNGRLPDNKRLELKAADGKQLATIDPCLVETTFAAWGAKSGGFDAVGSQDARKELTAENLKNYDAVWFYTTGELPLSDTQKSDLLAFVKNGGGFGGSHSATDTFYKWAPYGDLIGGYFDGHPWTQKVKVIVEDTSHPATKHFGESFEIKDEIYQFKGPFARDKQRVLMRLDMGSVKGLGKRKDGDNALAWVREYGKGRVFYTALGHFDEVWRDPRYEQHVMGALRYLFKLEDADATPRPAPTAPDVKK